MFPGGAQGFSGHTPEQEEELFMQGYGSVLVDNKALAYYRCERVIIDLALFGKVICNLEESRGNREQAFIYLESNFIPGGTIERAGSI
jgi:spectinomycin phosphotransferase